MRSWATARKTDYRRRNAIKVLTDRQFTKREALDALELPPDSKTIDEPSIAAGIILIRNCKKIEKLLPVGARS